MKDTPFSFRHLIDQGSLELTEDYIRQRAYQIYEQHGRQEGHDKDDWYQAEAEIFGKKPAPPGKMKQNEAQFALASAA